MTDIKELEKHNSQGCALYDQQKMKMISIAACFPDGLEEIVNLVGDSKTFRTMDDMQIQVVSNLVLLAALDIHISANQRVVDEIEFKR